LRTSIVVPVILTVAISLSSAATHHHLLLSLTTIHHVLLLMLVLLHHRMLLLLLLMVRLHVEDISLRNQAVDGLILLLLWDVLELILVHVNLILILHLIHGTAYTILLLLLLRSARWLKSRRLFVAPSERELRVPAYSLLS
jgi:hypothetical protein